MIGPLSPSLIALPPCVIGMFEMTTGFQHLAVGARSGFHKDAVGLHCCHTRAATTQAETIQEQPKKYMKYFWCLGGFRSFVKRIVTDSLAMLNDMIPVMNVSRSI